MKKFVFIFLLVVISNFHGFTQNYIGSHKLVIKKEMKEKNPDYYFSKEVMGGRHSFIKFEDYDGMRTLLFVLNDDGYCYYSILMCDYSLLKSTIDSLNRNFEYKNELLWIDYFAGKDNYSIKLKKKEWFFSIITRKFDDEN
ncbi:MAG: hypothetical protein PF487_13750 [Bacteroidales bacterium]|jgi:hypothetical protein|nr:hypothetical protein [Bacteroidales bacterium]